MHLWRENTRMQIRWATGSLLEPLDDFFGFFLVWRTWRKYGEMDVSFWDVCVHDIGALIFWVLSNIYSQQNWSTPKAWQTDQVFASCYPLAWYWFSLYQCTFPHLVSKFHRLLCSQYLPNTLNPALIGIIIDWQLHSEKMVPRISTTVKEMCALLVYNWVDILIKSQINKREVL